MQKCKNCGEQLELGMKICPECQTPIIEEIRCTKCNRILKSHWPKCPYCETPTGFATTPTPIGQPLQAKESPYDSAKYSVNIERDSGGPQEPVQNRTPRLELQPGKQLGDNYRIIRKIGSGGFGDVYEVENLVVGEHQALKVTTLRQEELKSLVQEFRARNAIKQKEHILEAYQPEVMTYEGQKVVVYPMELAEKSLREWLNETHANIQGRLEEGLELIRQACQGVQSIHDAGMVHLDLKPENLLMVKGRDGKWVVKVTDFGLARIEGLGGVFMEDGVGTPAYMAPEQILAAHWKDVTSKADIYGIGMILYELLDGDLPYSGTSKSIKEKKINREINIRRPSVQGRDLIISVVMNCLERELDRRIDTIKQLLSSLREEVSTTVPKQSTKEEKSLEDMLTSHPPPKANKKGEYPGKRFSEDYLRYIKPYIDKDRIYCRDFDIVIDNINGFNLMESGISLDVCVKQGSLVAQVDLVVLASLKEWATLKQIFEQVTENDAATYDAESITMAIEYFALGEQEKAEPLILKLAEVSERQIERIEAKVLRECCLGYHYKDDEWEEEFSFQLIPYEGRYLQSTDVINTLYILFTVNHRQPLVDKLLKVFSKVANGTDDHLALAVLYYTVSSDTDLVKKFLNKAERIASSDQTWALPDVAGEYMKLSFDKKKAGVILEKTLSNLNDDLSDLDDISREWKKTFGDVSSLRKYLDKMQSWIQEEYNKIYYSNYFRALLIIKGADVTYDLIGKITKQYFNDFHILSHCSYFALTELYDKRLTRTLFEKLLSLEPKDTLSMHQTIEVTSLIASKDEKIEILSKYHWLSEKLQSPYTFAEFGLTCIKLLNYVDKAREYLIKAKLVFKEEGLYALDKMKIQELEAEINK